MGKLYVADAFSKGGPIYIDIDLSIKFYTKTEKQPMFIRFEELLQFESVPSHYKPIGLKLALSKKIQ